MDSINWMYVTLTSGGFTAGMILANPVSKYILSKVATSSFEEGVLTGLMIAKEYPEVVTDIEDYEEELTK